MQSISRWGLVALALAVARPAQAQYEWTSSRPDGHAPIGVMGDHTHETGEFMLSYRFMRMSMQGSRDGTDPVDDTDIVAATGPYGYMVTPVEMPMTMHMAGIMFAPSDVVTLMAMGSYRSLSMGHVMRNGNHFTTESHGLGDASLSALIGLQRRGPVRVHANAGISFPTGSVEQKDVTPMSGGNAVQLPYPMQLGSGTFDLLPGLTVLGMSESLSWGLQARGVVRLGENDRGWTLGNRVEGTGWIALKVAERLSLSARALYQGWGDVEGADDPDLNPMMAPTMRRDLRAGTRLDVPVGFNFYFNDGALRGHRIAAEFQVPVYQDLNGPQLETDWTLTIGWQKSFAPIGSD